MHTSRGISSFAILIIIAIVLLGGVGYFMLYEKPAGEDTPTTVNQIPDTVSGTGSFQSLTALEYPVQCSVSYREDYAVVSGDTYIADGKIRGNFTIEQEDASYESHFIHDGSMIYSWTMTPAGMTALKIDTAASENSTTPQTTGGIDVDQQVDYECMPWDADTAVFTPPSDIEFKTHAELMQSMMMGADGEASLTQ